MSSIFSDMGDEEYDPSQDDPRLIYTFMGSAAGGKTTLAKNLPPKGILLAVHVCGFEIPLPTSDLIDDSYRLLIIPDPSYPSSTSPAVASRTMLAFLPPRSLVLKATAPPHRRKVSS
ncbi:uncharacterized protein ARMOST_17012 [Armillaria ostoyae]|uniref:Uncharacterized protein n=1 Tax=Armillaria ostoyae TaxID=47428 RepID=A0A284RXT6_ARMOS|nr:uncharacterized protein ARMOST_17012 [Armillaria ostoyae]